MTNHIFEINIRSLIIVFFAFVGNATVLGIDLVLITLLPAFLILYAHSFLTIEKRYILPLFFLVILFIIVSVRIPYINVWQGYKVYYDIWPIKAIALLFMVASTRELKWPMGNTLIFSILCIYLLLLGNVADNVRLVSLFGPNMLYRIFNILVAVSVLNLIIDYRNPAKWWLLGTTGLGLYGAILTGSSGALAVIAIIATIVLFKLSKLLFFSTMIVITIWGSTLLANILTAFQMPILGRLNYKIENFEDAHRFIALTEILTNPFSLYGYSTSDFNFADYPHNIFLELYAYYGLIGLAVSGVILIGLIKALPNLLEGHILPIVLLIIIIGSLFSGDLSDNYGAAGLAAGLLLQRHRSNRNSDEFPAHAKMSPMH